jgi:hypothetical protein
MLVIILATIWDVIVVTTQKWWKIKYLNLKMTFLHKNLHEEMCKIQLKGFVVIGNENKLCKLQKVLHG